LHNLSNSDIIDRHIDIMCSIADFCKDDSAVRARLRDRGSGRTRAAWVEVLGDRAAL